MWLVKVFTPADAPVESSALCAQANCRTPSESSNVRSQPRQPVFLDGSLIESLEGSFRNAMLGVSNLALGTWTRWIGKISISWKARAWASYSPQTSLSRARPSLQCVYTGPMPSFEPGAAPVASWTPAASTRGSDWSNVVPTPALAALIRSTPIMPATAAPSTITSLVSTGSEGSFEYTRSAERRV